MPFPYTSKPNYNCDDAEVVLLLNKFQVEADVMEAVVNPDSQRLGYIFSAVSAGSSNHDLSTDPYFHKACYAAVYKTIQKLVKSRDVVNLKIDDYTCPFSELFQGDLVILVMHKPWLQKAGITVTQLYADLHRYGYVIAEDPNDFSPTRLSVVENNFQQARLKRRLLLRTAHSEIVKDGLVNRFLANKLSCPDDPVLRFFYLYQVIELLIDKELTTSASNFVEEFSKKSSSGFGVINAYHDLKDAFSEKNRINKLFGERTGNVLQTSPSNDACKTFLKGCDISSVENYSENLYKVRNVVFHAWWNIPHNINLEFGKIVAGIEGDIPELVINYIPNIVQKKPEKPILKEPSPEMSDERATLAQLGFLKAIKSKIYSFFRRLLFQLSELT